MSLISSLLFNIIREACQVCENQRETIVNLSFIYKISNKLSFPSHRGRNKGANED